MSNNYKNYNMLANKITQKYKVAVKSDKFTGGYFLPYWLIYRSENTSLNDFLELFKKLKTNYPKTYFYPYSKQYTYNDLKNLKYTDLQIVIDMDDIDHICNN